jgi:hypothetical protein
MKRLTATLPDWRLQESGPRSHWPRPCARCLRQTSIRVGAHLCPRGTAGRSTTICIRPLAIRRSLVPGRPFCHAAAFRQARVYFGRPDQSSTRRYRRFTLFRFPCPPVAVLLCAKLCLPGEAESALQACNRQGIPRPTAHQRCQAPEATVSGAVFLLSPPRRPPWRAPARPLDFKPQASSLCGG